MEIQAFLSEPVRYSRPVHGGDINESFCIETSGGKYFLKTNDAAKFPRMLEKEARGLHWLRKHCTLKIPHVIRQGVFEQYQFLLLEWLEPSGSTGKDWENFGRSLAMMHRETNGLFGWGESNYIGSLPQLNNRTETWAAFYSEQRILPMVNLLCLNGSFDTGDRNKADKFCSRLEDLFPREPPSLLHGDLWSGNFMFTSQGSAVFDPATYYGHREMDIGMSLLFGGFDPRFYAAYEEMYPMTGSWKERLPFTQLYPLLVHAILFGGSYVQKCRQVLRAI
jgi:fructosamine-3-kinase